MASSASIPEKKHYKDGVEAQAKRDKKMKAKAKNTSRHASDSSSEMDSSDSNIPQGKGGKKIVKNTTHVGRDLIYIGNGVKEVTVHFGESRRSESPSSKTSKTKPECVEVSRREIHPYIALENDSVYKDFSHMQDGQINDTTKRFRLSRNFVFADPELDVALVELQRTDMEFPAEFKKFSQALPDKTFFLMGHPDGAGKALNKIDGPFQMTHEFRQAADDWSRRLTGTDGFVGVDNDKKLLFHCSFQQGASGSPGIAVVNGKDAVVVTMLLRGYPEWNYDPNTPPELLAQVGNNHCIEQGVNMIALYQKLHSQNIDLCVSIFGQCDN